MQGFSDVPLELSLRHPRHRLPAGGLGLDVQRAQGHNPKEKKPLRLPTIRPLKSRLRQEVWNEAVQNVVKVGHEKKSFAVWKNSWRLEIGQFE